MEEGNAPKSKAEGSVNDNGAGNKAVAYRRPQSTRQPIVTINSNGGWGPQCMSSTGGGGLAMGPHSVRGGRTRHPNQGSAPVIATTN